MDIPEDVMKAAFGVAVHMELHGALGSTTKAKAEVIARAILAERERCAKVAESKMRDFGCIAGTEAHDLVVLCADLADEIRRGDT